jgi:hypothetical protein
LRFEADSSFPPGETQPPCQYFFFSIILTFFHLAPFSSSFFFFFFFLFTSFAFEAFQSVVNHARWIIDRISTPLYASLYHLRRLCWYCGFLPDGRQGRVMGLMIGWLSWHLYVTFFSTFQPRVCNATADTGFLQIGALGYSVDNLVCKNTSAIMPIKYNG